MQSYHKLTGFSPVVLFFLHSARVMHGVQRPFLTVLTYCSCLLPFIVFTAVPEMLPHKPSPSHLCHYQSPRILIYRSTAFHLDEKYCHILITHLFFMFHKIHPVINIGSVI